jgi:hypothetical protein
MVVASAFLWVCFGFDSTWEQLNPFFDALFRNPITALVDLFHPSSILRIEMRSFYGMGDHWSAPVIYGIVFIILSIHLERMGIAKSRNFFITTSLSLMNIGIFEVLWNLFYSIFHNQPWAFTFVPKQLYNLGFFVSFIFVGILASLILYGWGYRFKFTQLKTTLTIFAIGLWLLWIFYPFPIGHITVQTDWGSWTNSNRFPQTYYVVDVTDDGYASGLPHWIENNPLHLLNTVCKIAMTASILGFCMVEKKNV